MVGVFEVPARHFSFDHAGIRSSAAWWRGVAQEFVMGGV